MADALENGKGRTADRNPLPAEAAVTTCSLSHGHLYGLKVANAPLFVLDGSFHTRPSDHKDVLLQQLTAVALTNGTRRRDALEIADMVERRGAMMSISSEDRRVAFSAKACTDDLATVAELLLECMLEPRFEAAELALDQERMIAELQYRALFPRIMASEALTRLLYPYGDVRYRDEAAASVSLIERVGVDDVQRFYQQQFGAEDLRIVAVGDVDPARAADALDRQLTAWCSRPVGTLGDVVQAQPAARSARIEVPGDRYAVAFGQRLALRCDHPDYATMWLANHVFGGSFTSRLVRTVRDEQGLSYSVSSQLTRPDPQLDGHWLVELSLSPDKLDAGVNAARLEIERFMGGGVTHREVEAGKIQAIGEFQVSLASLSGMSEAILSGVEQGHGPDHIRSFAGRIEAITVDDVNRVVSQQLRSDALCQVIAGPGT